MHQPTLPYSPYQNGKQEVFWASVEGRLMAMLDGVAELTLERLNEASQAWVELEYQRKVHAELGCTRLKRALQGRSVGRASPDSESLRRAFRQQIQRKQRRSDGTVSVHGCRFELPARYRALDRVTLRYARWALRRVDLIDPDTAQVVCAIYPLDKTAHADGQRRRIEPDEAETAANGSGEIAPLLQQLIAEYAASGLPPAYIRSAEESADES